MPIASGYAAVWLEAPIGAEVGSIAQAGDQLPILRRHRIFGIKRQTIVLIVGNALRDGAPVTLQLRYGDEDLQRALVVRLAKWSDPGTSRVVRFIASEVLPEVPTADQTPLIRYLSLTAAWRQRCRTVRIDDFQICAVETRAEVFGDEFSFFAIEDDKVEAYRARAFAIDARRSVIIVPSHRSHTSYVGGGSSLVELEIEEEVERFDFSELPHSTVASITDWLFDEKINSPALLKELAQSIRPAARQSDLDEFAVECLRSGENLIFSVQCSASKHVEDVRVQFADGEVTELNCERFRRVDFTSGGVTQRKIISPIRHSGSSPLCKITGAYDDAEIVRWCNISTSTVELSGRLLNSFWPASGQDNQFLGEVARPLISAQTAQLARTWQASEIKLFEHPQASGRDIEVQIISQGKIEYLQNWLLALGMGVGNTCKVRIVLNNPDREADVVRVLRPLAEQFGVSAVVEVVRHDLPVLWWPKSAAKQARYIVSVRETALPGVSTWLDQIQRAASEATVLYHRDNRGQVVGIAGPDKLLARKDLRDLNYQTFEHAWAYWLDQIVFSQVAEVRPDLRLFVNQTEQRPDTFDQRFDVFLRRVHSIGEHSQTDNVDSSNVVAIKSEAKRPRLRRAEKV
jgi:hypothetical protein